MAHNNLDVYVPSDRDDELGQLAQRFNGMLVALKHNQEQLVENQRELNQAQIRMLQAQLNPHFLCNTLDTMKWISKINQVPQVALMSTNLADILRFCISPEEFVPLHREVEILKRYIEIQKIRLSGLLFLPGGHSAGAGGLPGAQDDPPAHRWKTPSSTAWKGWRTAASRCWPGGPGRDCCASPSPTTAGACPRRWPGAYAHRSRELSRGHLGLYNVDTILRKYYGEDFGLYLSTGEQGRGAVVSATIPLRREEETEC